MVAIGFAAALNVVRIFEFRTLNVWFDENAYGPIVWALLGFHTAHILTDLMDSSVLAAVLFIGPMEEKTFVDVSENALYWYFVVAAWLPTMPSSTLRRAWREPHERRRQLVLWLGVLAGPLVWLALLQTNYVLSCVACEVRQTWFLHAATVVSLAVVAGAGMAAWSARAPRTPLDDAGSGVTGHELSEARATWMAGAGTVMSVWFALVILAMEDPILIIPPCIGR